MGRRELILSIIAAPFVKRCKPQAVNLNVAMTVTAMEAVSLHEFVNSGALWPAMSAAAGRTRVLELQAPPEKLP